VLTKLEAFSHADLDGWIHQVKLQSNQGQVASRISLLSKTDPQWFAVEIRTQAGVLYQCGDLDRAFPLMSAIKPFLLLCLLEQRGMQVFDFVGVEPSGLPFNSLQQLIDDGGRPRNPMINSGAITLADKLPGKTGDDRCQQFCTWLNQQAGCQLSLDEAMLRSVRSAGREPNQALVHYLSQAGALTDPEIAIDTYEQICCLSGCISDLAQLGTLLAIDRSQLANGHRRTVNAIMLSCGLYEASAVYAVRIGLPIKSGISGALVAVVPHQGAIACYSPTLDRVGNPVAAVALVEILSQALQLSVFG
jgi:glutaminase